MTELRHPAVEEIPALRGLWREAFDESEGFLDLFFSVAFAPNRCLVAAEEGRISAMLYWFDCVLDGSPAAYLYGVAAAKDCRGRGLATALMEAAHRRLKGAGYGAAILVPAEQTLFRFYARRGYETLGYLSQRRMEAAQAPVPAREIGPGEYAALRRALLPEHAVIQEKENLALLAGYARFLAGEGWCAVYVPGETPLVAEFLGDQKQAPGLLAALGVPAATVRGPGDDRPFAMAHTLAGQACQKLYFAFAFD